MYLALGVDASGRKDVLGLWIEQTEGAKFWLRVFNDLKTLRAEDILISGGDGLRGFPEASEGVFPNAMIQTWIVHLIRNSVNYVAWKDRKPLAAQLKPVYEAVSADAAEAALAAFEQGPYGIKCPPIAQTWRRQWAQVVPFFAFPPESSQPIRHNLWRALHTKIRIPPPTVDWTN